MKAPVILLLATMALTPALGQAEMPAPAAVESATASAPVSASPAMADTGTRTGEKEPAKPAQPKTIMEQIRQGGWVMLPIALCSIATIYLIGNGLLNTSKNRVAPPLDVRNLRHLFRSGDYEAAHKYCVQHPGAFTSVLQSGIEMLGDGKLATEEAMAGELGKQNAKIQTSLSYLSVIGVCTPMIGLLGTVTGMIKAFATLGSSGIGDPSSLSSAIGEVLVATASGLFIAIPAFGAFYFLRNRAGAAMHHVQDLIAAFFRKMPYDELTGARYGDGEIIAGSPQRNAEAQM